MSTKKTHTRRSLLKMMAGAATAAAVSATALPQVASASSPKWPFLYWGSKGVEVRALQYLLRGSISLSGKRLAVDGHFGSQTRRYLIAYQKHVIDVSPSGATHPSTWHKLARIQGRGDRGDRVRAAQMLLNTRIGAGLAVDGIYGRLTESAVKRYHKRIGRDSLEGSVHNTTWRYLLNP